MDGVIKLSAEIIYEEDDIYVAGLSAFPLKKNLQLTFYDTGMGIKE